MGQRTKKYLLLTPLAAAIAAIPAFAQTAGSGELERVEVTASKRKQLVVDVPYAVTAIGGQEIRDRGVQDISEMQSVVPSLFITTNAPGENRYQLRGMSTIAGSPTVGMYLDEMTINLDQIQRAIDIPLVDMNRIEVLRGPQGTLYGDGSLGGTIKFVTQNPKLDRTEFIGEAGMKSVKNGQSAWFGNVVANVPLSKDVAGIRLVAGYEKLPGWVDNTVNGQSDINGGNREFIRAKGLVQISPTLDATVLLYHYHLKQDNPTFSDANGRTASYYAAPNTDETNLANVVINKDLGFATLTSSTGYTDRSLLQHLDVTAFFSAILPPFLLAPGTSVGLRTPIKARILTEELRLASPDKGPLTWLAGLYYRKSDTNESRTTPTSGAPLTFIDEHGTSPVNTRQWAAFGEVSYAVTPTVIVTGGLRYFKDSQELVTTSAAGTRTESAKFNATSPKLNVLWKYAKDQSFYATVSKGFRSGGFNTSPPPSYGPESLWNYEVGAKGAVAGGKVLYDAAIYYQKYKDVQGLDIPPGGLFATTINTGRASGPGADFALSTEVTKGLTVDAAVGYVGIKYDVKTADRNVGDPLNYIPKLTASMGATWRFQWPMLGMPGMLRFDYQHSDAARIIVRNQGIDSHTDAANYVNVRLGIEQPRWQVYLEGRNLGNFQGIINPAVGAQVNDVRPMPRSIGVTLRTQM